MNHEETIRYLQRKHDEFMDTMLEAALSGDTAGSDKAAKLAHSCDEVIEIIKGDFSVRTDNSAEDRSPAQVLCR